MNADATHDTGRLQVVSGNPTDDEIAALVTVFGVLGRERGTPHTPHDTRIAGGWTSRWHLLNHGVLPGAAAWRSTFRR